MAGKLSAMIRITKECGEDANVTNAVNEIQNFVNQSRHLLPYGMKLEIIKVEIKEQEEKAKNE
jgi:hypothetical protein